MCPLIQLEKMPEAGSDKKRAGDDEEPVLPSRYSSPPTLFFFGFPTIHPP